MANFKDIILRRANITDMEAIFNWRNDPKIRQSSFNSERISWENHVRWFKQIIVSRQHHLLIGEIEHQPVGVLRYDIQNTIVEVSIYLIPGMEGQGLGNRLLLAGNDWVKSHLPAIKKIEAKILSDNKISLKTFTKAGFAPAFYIYDFVIE